MNHEPIDFKGFFDSNNLYADPDGTPKNPTQNSVSID